MPEVSSVGGGLVFLNFPFKKIARCTYLIRFYLWVVIFIKKSVWLVRRLPIGLKTEFRYSTEEPKWSILMVGPN